jgi:hypothetical protein
MVIELPLNDYVIKYEKLSSEALNYRNIRQLIPENMFRMLKNLVERELEPSILKGVIETIFESLSGRLSELNSIRIFKSAIKLK